MNVAVAKPHLVTVSGEAFAQVRDRLPGSAAVMDARREAFAQFERQGLPHRRIEEWKYTDLRATMREVLPLAAAPDKAALAKAEPALKAVAVTSARRLVLVDGVLVPEISDMTGLEKGLAIRSLRDALDNGSDSEWQRIMRPDDKADVMVAFNAAMATDGVVIEVSHDVELSKPLHIVHVATAKSAASVTRSALLVGRNAKVTFIESFIAADGAKAYQAHDALVITVGDDARLDHVRLMEDATDAFNISSAFVKVGGKSHYNIFNMTSGGAVSRYQSHILCAGEYAEISTNGVNLLVGTQHGDTTLVLDHAVPNCSSREVFRAVLDGRAHSVFQGRIIVQPGAQKTDAKMMTRALLLSDECEAANKPELEIFADDVTCGHGATSGALDESLLFYLRARGLPEKDAQALLIAAFVGEAIESIVNDDLRELAVGTAERWLAARA